MFIRKIVNCIGCSLINRPVNQFRGELPDDVHHVSEPLLLVVHRGIPVFILVADKGIGVNDNAHVCFAVGLASLVLTTADLEHFFLNGPVLLGDVVVEVQAPRKISRIETAPVTISAPEQIIQMMAVALSLDQGEQLAEDWILRGKSCMIILRLDIFFPQEGAGIEGDLLAFRPLGTRSS